MAKIQSIEPNIADLANGWLKSYKLNYKLEQESLNTEIDQALYDYFSKSGGKGGNRPDVKLMLKADDGKNYPILIEYKGYKDKLLWKQHLNNNGICFKQQLIDRMKGQMFFSGNFVHSLTVYLHLDNSHFLWGQLC